LLKSFLVRNWCGAHLVRWAQRTPTISEHSGVE
jgi:hypothetical protein